MVAENYPESLDAFLSEMKVFVVAAKKAARDAGKPLLIVYGENHISEKEVIIQSVLLKAAADHGVKKYYGELDQTRLEFNDIYSFESRTRNIDFALPMAERGLGMDVEVIDKEINFFGFGKNSYAQAVSPEGFNERDDHMIEQLMQENEGGFVHIGCMHLSSFAHSEALANHYHVVPVMHSGLLENATLSSPDYLNYVAGIPSMNDRYSYLATGHATRLECPDALEGIPERTLFMHLLGDQFEKFACTKKEAEAQEIISVTRASLSGPLPPSTLRSLSRFRVYNR